METFGVLHKFNKKIMITVKEITTKLKISKDKGRYDVFDPEVLSCPRFVHRYLCSITKHKSGFSIIGQSEVYYNLDKLVSAIYKYANELPYPSSYYNPCLRKGYFLELVINDYMTNLKSKRVNGGYKLPISTIYNSIINITILFGEFTDLHGEPREMLDISLSLSDYSTVSVKSKRDPESVIQGIGTLLKPLYLTNGISFIELSDKLTLGNNEMIYSTFDPQTLTFKSGSYKEELKKKLQEIIDKLN